MSRDALEDETFGLFAELLDDIEHDTEAGEAAKRDMRRVATKKELAELVEHLGGMERWSEVCDDFKTAMFDYLDYKTRVRLGWCSKDDYRLVKASTVPVNRIVISDTENSHYQLRDEPFENVQVRVEFNAEDRFTLVFSQLDDVHTQIQWMKYFPRKRPETRSIVREHCNYYEEAVKFAESWMKRSCFKFEALTVGMQNYPIATSILNTSNRVFPNCKKFRIGAASVEEFAWWLGKMPTHLDDLQLITTPFERRDVFTLTSAVLETPQVMNASRFHFWCRAAFTDSQFSELSARRMSFDATETLTDDGINQFLKRWVRGEGVDGFKEALIWSTREFSQQRILNGLDARLWDETFEEEARGFCGDFDRCCGRGTNFQITRQNRPFESVTVSLNARRVSIYATGHKMTWNGVTYTNYQIP